MTDYYVELKLSQSLNASELCQELNKLEDLWHRREVTNPEKAAKMIALIVEARDMLKDEQSRRNYDAQLKKNKQGSMQKDPDAERLQSFIEWRKKATSFYEENQYDLAVTALEKAVSYMSADYEDSAFFNEAALIYNDNNDCDIAMEYINKAIIIDSNNPEYYLTKGLVYLELSNKQQPFSGDAYNIRVKAEEMALKAHELACRENIFKIRANAAGFLASYYDFMGDEEKAENFAQEAVEYGETWGNGKRVLDSIKERKEQQQEEERKRQAEEKQREEERQQHAEENQRKSKEQMRENERLKREQEALIAKRKRLYIIGWLVWLVCQAVNGPIFLASVTETGSTFMTTPLFLILTVAGTVFPSYVEAAHKGYRGILGGCCIFSIIMYCIYTQYISGVSFFSLLIVLVILQFVSWLIGKKRKIS